MADNVPVGSEALHESNGDPDWIEVWDNWFVLPEERRGGYVSLIIRPHDGVCWYWAALVGFDRPLVTVLVDDLPLPRADSLELRASGIWTDTTVLRPFEHLTTDLEAFGVSLDHPADVWTGAFGDRVAVGLELDWDTDRVSGPSPVAGTTGYRLVGRMHGEVLLDDNRWQMEGIGVRDHWWGVPDSSSSWRGWASRDGELINSDGGPLDLDLDAIVRELPTGEVHPGLSIAAWAPAGGAGRRHARALAIDDRNRFPESQSLG
ncbi:MAG: hypothetical protein EX269_14180, partial [Acidimicrobiales bacterium]